MTLTEHLAELRTRIIRRLLAVVIGIIIVMAAYDPVLRFLAQPYVDLCAARGPIVLRRRPAVPQPARGLHHPAVDLHVRRDHPGPAGDHVADLAVHRPALHAKEKKYAIPFVLSSVVLFALGGVRRLLDARQGARVPDLVGRPRRRGQLPDQQVHQPRRVDDRRLRHHLRVPGAAGVPADSSACSRRRR